MASTGNEELLEKSWVSGFKFDSGLIEAMLTVFISESLMAAEVCRVLNVQITLKGT
jgi:hypothetical protein